MKTELPQKYDHIISEEKWQLQWDNWGVYQWDKTQPRENTFAVDTPPPTVSGSLHVGHVFSYTQTDVLARFQRMRGKNVFYPMGWDDNGLPTERRVQNVFGISCNPHISYDANWKPEKVTGKDNKNQEISRQNFIEACAQLTQEDEAAFEHMWKHLGLSIDWTQQYSTIDAHCRKLSQLSFLDLVKKGYAYKKYSVTMWDVDFKTAVAQAEIEDRPKPGMYHDIIFKVKDSDETFTIATTRPELLSGCIAVVAHPSDNRFQHLFGREAITPLFGATVPIMPAEHADPEKGTGILMVCTFGDIHDVEFWKKNQETLPFKQVIGFDGRFINSGELNNLKIKQARIKVVELLKEQGLLIKETPTEHAVKFYEKGDSPIEFMPTYQWFIKILDFKKELLEQGEKVKWHPDYMKTRYHNWVEGLNQDWCISRQRFFGVPFPVWYPIKEGNLPDFENPIYPKNSANLPIDPMSQAPDGYTEDQRGLKPGGFIGDTDVMDTWATSSLTPQLMSHWGLDEARHASIFPMDIRPQSHEIIRTWAFYTIVKAFYHSNEIPWKHVIISGWVLDPDRKKMSKSKGNVVTPGALLEQHSSDAVRYWAARARLGVDTAYEDSIFAIGKKLTTKLFNASKFVMMQLKDGGCTEVLSLSDITEPLDLSFMAKLNTLIETATAYFEKFEYAGALEATEALFWIFCDHYIELVKGRAYQETGAPQRSALATLDLSLKTLLQLFAPFLPFITEEIWASRYTSETCPSIHKSPWPHPQKTEVSAHIFETAVTVLSEIRATKTQAQKSMKQPVSSLTVSAPANTLDDIKLAEADIVRAGTLTNPISYREAENLNVEVDLATELS